MVRNIKEYFRFLLIGPESVIWVLGFGIYVFLGETIAGLAANWNVADQKTIWLLALPLGLTAWIAATGKKLLFHDADKKHLLQKWPDFWRLEAAVKAALTHAVVFFGMSGVAVLACSWSPPPSWALISFATGLFGVATDAYTCYWAEIELAKAVRKLDANSI